MTKLLPLCAVSVLVALPLVRLQEPKEGKKQEHDTELARHMEVIEDTARALRKSLKDESTRPAALEALAEIERLSVLVKGLVPEAASKLPEAERGAFVTAYRRTMVDFLMRQLELEAALLDGDAEKAKTAFEAFRAMEDSSHERFAPEDD
jgi:hypothetical protein